MKRIKITVLRKARYDDLIAKYENPIDHACDLEEGQVFYCEGWQKPKGFCDSAWETLSQRHRHGGSTLRQTSNPASAGDVRQEPNLQNRRCGRL